jgi:CubicO group peptidase (beta-lactamase class C family)
MLHLASLAKLVVGDMALMLAIDSGRISLGDRAANYIPRWGADSVKSTITIRQLAGHTSGHDDVNLATDAGSHLTGWEKEYYGSNSARFKLAQERLQVVLPPGTEYSYSGADYYNLAYCLAASLRGSQLPDVRTLLEQRLMRPLGIPAEAWVLNYGEETRLDGMNLYAIGSGAKFTPRAAAKVGQLILNHGSWGGRQILSAEAVDSIVGTDDILPASLISTDPEPQAALGCWVNRNKFWPSLPEDAIVGAGAAHVVLLVVPSLDLVMARFGGTLTGTQWDDRIWGELEQHLFAPLMRTLQSRESPGR